MEEIYSASFQLKEGIVSLLGEEKVCAAKHFFPENSEGLVWCRQWLAGLC